MESPDSKDYANRPCGEGVVFYNQHLQAAEQAAQQRLPGTQSQQDAQDEQQAQPQPRLQPDLQPPASLLQQALPPPPQQQQRPPVPASGQTGAAAALLPGLSRAEEGDGEAGPSAAAGVIFGCTNSTYEECFRLSMVGLPRKYLPLVESIVAEHTLIFLFNFSDRQLHGVYIATSAGQARHAMHHSTMGCSGAVQPYHASIASRGRCIATRGAAHPPLDTTCQGVQPFASAAANPPRLLGYYRPVHAAPCMLQRRAPEAAAPRARPTRSQENLSLSAWKGLAGVPKAGRKDEHAQPSGIELEEQAADPDGSPFPAQCGGMPHALSWWCHSSPPRRPGADAPGS